MLDLYDLHHEKEQEINPQLKVGLKEKISYFKLSLATSPFNRSRLIRNLNKRILKVESNDTVELNEITDIIDRYDLKDPRYGKVLNEDSIKLLYSKLAENKKLSEEAEIQ